MKTKTFALIAVMGFACVGASAQSPSTTPDGYVMRNQQIYVIRNGQATPLEGDVTMKITPAGQITGFDGQSRQLSESVMLTVDGRVLPVPPGTVFPATPSAPAVIDRFADRRAQLQNDSGDNRSGLATAPSGSSGNQSSSTTSTTGVMPNENSGFSGAVEGSQVPLGNGNNNGGGNNAFPLYNNGVIPVVTDPAIPGSTINGNTNPNNSTLQSNVPVVDPLTGQATIQSSGNTPVNNAAGSMNDSNANPNTGDQINNNANGSTNNNFNPNQGQPVPSAGMNNNNNQGSQNQNQNQQDQNRNSETNNNVNRSQGPEDRQNSSNATSPNRNSSNNNDNRDAGTTSGSQSRGGSNNNSSGSSGSGSSSGSGAGSSSSGGGGGGSGASSGGVTQ